MPREPNGPRGMTIAGLGRPRALRGRGTAWAKLHMRHLPYIYGRGRGAMHGAKGRLGLDNNREGFRNIPHI
jgi:hypothetical protein